jgi:hypothetical protein
LRVSPSGIDEPNEAKDCNAPPAPDGGRCRSGFMARRMLTKSIFQYQERGHAEWF